MGSYIVKMAEFKVEKNASCLKTNSLGSCVGIVLYDRYTKIGGMAHIMLPKAPQSQSLEIGRYANLAIPRLLQNMLELGAKRHHIQAMLFGGADMFSSAKEHSVLEIGCHNIRMSKQILDEEHIPILFEDIGGKIGRSVELNCETGEVFVRDFIHEKQHVSFT